MGRASGQEASTELLGVVRRGAISDCQAARRRLEDLLPWRSVDGAPLGMRIEQVAFLSEAEGGRPAGSLFAVVSADSLDAAEVIRSALAVHAGLSEEEWDSGWFEGPGRVFSIRVFPTV